MAYVAKGILAERLTDAELDEVAKFVPQAEAALKLAREKPLSDLTFTELIAASSLGSPESLYRRSLTSPAVREMFKRRLRYTE